MKTRVRVRIMVRVRIIKIEALDCLVHIVGLFVVCESLHQVQIG